jgi:hypothetical protein
MSGIARLFGNVSARTILAGWLALSVVGAQIAGLVHRVEHPWPADVNAAWIERAADAPAQAKQAAHCDAEPAPSHPHKAEACAATAGRSGDHDPEHDCAAYDALTLGDGPPLAASPISIAPTACMDVALRDAPAHVAALVLGYRTRAPPSA